MSEIANIGTIPRFSEQGYAWCFKYWKEKRIEKHYCSSKQKKEMIIYIDNRIQQKKLEVKNNSESTLNYISIFNKLIATLLLDLVYFEILYIYI